ncbi:MAG: hypothetical protein BEN19_03440 [Epulopiscium sp. Nuni2H_MBin003]|nr:MAG: hypothetical protein BEN19_03440 [Epulopiscium sp. Nuni2H_MBin003]
MALDGIVLSNIIHELKQKIIGGKIDKIYQLEQAELLLTIRNNKTNYKLLLNAGSQYPRINFSTLSKNETNTPPMFCMFLRKHIGGGKIIDIIQPNFERIVKICIEAKDELGDITNKILILEIMGRHSNIILIKEDNLILDSIKHISYDKSKVRPILPNYIYNYPPNQDKLNPLLVNKLTFIEAISSLDNEIYKRLYQTFSGLSPLISRQICLDAKLDSHAKDISENGLLALYNAFNNIITYVKSANFTPTLYETQDGDLVDYYSFDLPIIEADKKTHNQSINDILEQFTHTKNHRYNISQKTADIKKLIITFIDRTTRKEALLQQAVKTSTDNELFKIYGELITAYSYNITPGDNNFTTLNYYDTNPQEIVIPLDTNKSAIENAQAYFKKYSKLKRAHSAALEQLDIIKDDLKYLQSVLVCLDMLENETDIMELRQELIDMGYLKRKLKDSKKKTKNKQPYLHFKTSSNLDIYVGKNNYQNDELTMKFAKAHDMWLHLKNGAGSHVIIKSQNGYEFTNQDLYEGAILAAYHSSARLSSNVQIDYTLRKNIKKIPSQKPGMVIYNNFKTLSVTPTENEVNMLLAVTNK